MTDIPTEDDANTLQRRLVKAFGWFLIVSVITIASGGAYEYLNRHERYIAPDEFKRNLSSFEGATIGATKQVVAYESGFPSMVVDAPGEWHDAKLSTIDPYAYDYWQYNHAGLTFNPATNRLEEIICFADVAYRCGQILGVGTSDSEDDVRGLLGEPAREKLTPGSRKNGEIFNPQKTLIYPQLGLELILEESRVIGIRKVEPMDPPNYVQWLFGWS